MKKLFLSLLPGVSFLLGACNGSSPDPAAKHGIEKTAKVNIGSQIALYPRPIAVVGVWVDDRVNWMLVGNTGVIGHDRILLSMRKTHHTNAGIRAAKRLSVNIVDREMLPLADYVGSVSGAEVDKSHTFDFHAGAAGTPVIDASPLVMECEVVDNYESGGFDNFVCTVTNTYADPTILDAGGRIDYDAFRPVLFDYPTYTYRATGGPIGRCLALEPDAGGTGKLPQTAKSVVRLARLEIHPQWLEAYKAAVVENAEASLRLEPGVLTMYAVAEKSDPCRITILETYADEASYRSHLQTPHFRKYKTGTLKMIRSLDLVETDPLNTSVRLVSVFPE